MHLVFLCTFGKYFLFFWSVELRYFIHPKRLGDVWFVLSTTPAVFIPSFSNSVGYDCSLIDHVHPIFCVYFDNIAEC